MVNLWYTYPFSIPWPEAEFLDICEWLMNELGKIYEQDVLYS